MDERKITVSCSYSRRVNLGNYESKDYWHSESRELPADSSQEQVDAMRRHLHKTVVDFVERQIAPQKPPEAPKILMMMRDGGCAHKAEEPCWPCKQAFKNGAVQATPKEVVPDTVDGQPFSG